MIPDGIAAASENRSNTEKIIQDMSSQFQYSEYDEQHDYW